MDAWAKFAGMDRFEARKAVKKTLKDLGLERGSKPQMALGVESKRTGVVVEPRLSVQWFVDIKPLAEPALEAVNRAKRKSFLKAGRRPTTTGWRTFRTGAFRDNFGGGIESLRGTMKTGKYTLGAPKRKSGKSIH